MKTTVEVSTGNRQITYKNIYFETTEISVAFLHSILVYEDGSSNTLYTTGRSGVK